MKPTRTKSWDGLLILVLCMVVLWLALAACSSKPMVVAVDTLCISTSRPPISEAQRAQFKADQGLWEPLVDWLASFIRVRDAKCLKPEQGSP